MSAIVSQVNLFRPAARIGAIGVSEILTITAAANALKKIGKPVIVLGAGEPDFDTPENIKSAAIRAISAGETKYTVLDGTAELKSAIGAKFKRENGLDYSANEITCAAGAKQILFNAFMATLDAGDEVIIPAPYWASYVDIVGIAGGKPVTPQCSEGQSFKLTPAQLEASITSRTRWLLLNSPSNPSGAAYSAQDLRGLADVLLHHPNVWVISDDIYEHIIFNGFAFATLAAVEPRLRDRILTVNGVSKAYAMTGWRLGYGAGPSALIRAMAIVQSQSTSCPSSVSQAAAVEALNSPPAGLIARQQSFQQRRDLVVDALNAAPGLTCRRPEGAFYVYASCAGVIGKKTPFGQEITSDSDFCRYLLDVYNVAVVPGASFGLAPFFRVSYAASKAELEEACARINSACEALC